MAIAKMNKLTLISFHEQKDQLLKSIQELQNLEVVDLHATELGDLDISTNDVEQLRTTIKHCETQIDQIESALTFLQSHLPKPSLLKKLRTKKQAYTLDRLSAEVDQFSTKELVNHLLNKQIELEKIDEQRQELTEEESFLSNWQKLNFCKQDVQNPKFITGSVGTVPQHIQNQYINQLKEADILFVEEIYQNKYEHGVFIAYDLTNKEEVQDLLNDCHFDDLTTNFVELPSEALKKIKHELTELQASQKQIISDLEKMGTEEWQLMLADEYYQAMLEREKSKLLFIDEKHLFVMEGWLEEAEVDSMKQALEETLSQHDYALLITDVMEEDYNRVPTVLKNNGFVAPFENITEMYNLPKYNEIDPTPYLAPFYFVFFGMMVADLGYGLLLFLATFLAFKLFNFDSTMKKNLKFFHLISYPTMIWGLIYGSFFGFELPFVLLSTIDDVITILVISVVFGLIHIFVALGLNTYLKLRDGDKYGSVADGFGWIMILLGLIILLVGSMLINNQLLSQIGGGLAILGVLSILGATMLASKNKALGLGLGVYNLYGVTGYIGDIVSYSRLMALGVSGASIALAFNMIIGFIPPIGRFTIGIVLFVALHALNLGLTMLSAYVHGARLILVEFFGKFYEGGGKAFKPLKASEKYIQLKSKNERLRDGGI
ncbi:V-type ATP synthase subunit I [Amphibacillus indicireducens]|uniref:V-type ATP synthase subunit I n=1 Tax=Amphibacillus indicireducens TaxID=1076330 RepID=A0ABP7VLG6_9BACI